MSAIHMTHSFFVTFCMMAALPLAIDLVWFVMIIRRQVKGRGPSPVPVLSLFLYALMPFLAKPIPISVKTELIGFGLLAHLFLIYLAPRLWATAKPSR